MIDKRDEIRPVLEYINENDVRSFWRFLDWCQQNKPEWVPLLDRERYGYMLKAYISSRRHKLGSMTKSKAQARRDQAGVK